MIAPQVALATAVLIASAAFSGASEPSTPAPHRPSEAAPADRDRPVAAAEREPKSKERTPPPRPIVAPAGQQENPALREECAWIGQRIVSLLFRDDPMTGNDFVPFYGRFGCPEAHLTQAFACVVSFGSLENDALADRIAVCWTDPTQRPATGQGKNGSAGPGDAGAGDPRPGDSKPAGTKPGETKPGDTKPGDTKPGDTKPGDGKPADTKPADTKPGDGKPGNGKAPGAAPPPAKPADGTQK